MNDNLDDEFYFDDDEDDLLLAEAADASVVACEASRTSVPVEEELADISFGVENSTFKDGAEYNDSSGFDRSCGEIWIYPTNYPVRDYQYNIVQQALYRNTLVVLPTGLGKTFIAAVVMYNLYRWFPQGKVVFMAPTKPLVAQQIQACYNIMGIPKADTAEMTGNMHPSEREKMWKQKRVIYLTPQVMTNDLSRGSFAASSIKCLVVDEAHKATGNHAYCQVVRELLNFAKDFRVLALSATPGSDLKRVQQVMANLLIAHIELRSEDSIDIRPYTHERKVDKIVVPMGEELSGIRLKYIQIMEMVVGRLIRYKVLYNRDATKLSKFLILKARDEYRQNPPLNLQGPQSGMVEGDFAMAMSLYHGFELLQLHGLRSLYNFLLGIQSGDKGYGRTRYELTRNADFIDIMEELHKKFAQKAMIGKGEEKDVKMIVGHPKMQRLEEIVIEHFKSFQEKNMDTRVMIFSQYRDSVEELRNILNQHQPLVKVMAFIGQSSVGKSTKGYSQKEQLKVMRQFREGGFNTLVSTCVGEEGLDIGDVDLIVCFDAHKSPIRLVQRMGRTGRKRMGRIVMLVTKGKEEQIYNQSLYSKKSIHKAILNGAKTLHFYPHNPPLIPPGIKPKCHKMFITVKPDTNNKKASTTANAEDGSKASRNQTISNVLAKSRSKQKSSELSNSEYEVIRQEFCQISKVAKHIPRPKFASLSRNNHDDDESENRAEMNLSEWTPWQNRLQQTYLVGHSTRTRNLVKTCEFIELQQSIGEEANSYGLEMELYLNKADISNLSLLSKSNSNVSGQCSITSFFTLSQKHKDANDSSSKNSDTASTSTVVYDKKVSNGKKRHKNKSKFSKAIDEDVIYTIQEENDELFDKNTNKSVMSSKKSSNLFTAIKDVAEREEISNVEIINDQRVDYGEMPCQNVTIEKVSKKKKLLNAKDITWTDAHLKKSGNHVHINETGAKRLKRSDRAQKDKIGNRRCSAYKELDVKLPQQKEKDQSNNVRKHKVSIMGDQERHEGILCSPVMRSDKVIDVDKNFIDSEGKEVEEAGTKVFNDFAMIPTPPRVEEVEKLFSQLKSPLDFASLDIYQLVDEWKRDEPCWNFSNLSTMFDSQSNFEQTQLEQRSDLTQNDSPVTLETVEEGERNTLPLFKKGKTKACDKDKQENEILSVGSRQESMPKHSPEVNPISNIGGIQKEDELSASLKTKYTNLHASKLHSSRLSEKNCEDQSLLFGQREQESNQLHLRQTPYTYVANEFLSSKIGNAKLSPCGPVDSMDEHMIAIDVGSCLFSPPRKWTSQAKPISASKSNSNLSQSPSLASWSQAFKYLHSSSPDTQLSPYRSHVMRTTPGSSVRPKKQTVISPIQSSKLTELVKTSPFSVEKEGLRDAVFTSTPVFENSPKKSFRRHEARSCEKKQTLISNYTTPVKQVKNKFDFSEPEDESSFEIIPPTPDKDDSIKSPARSRSDQMSVVKERNSNLCVKSSLVKPTDVKVGENAARKSLENMSQLKTPLKKDANYIVTASSKKMEKSPNTSNGKNMPMTAQPVISFFDADGDDDDDDCIIVTTPLKRKKMPFSSYENLDCIESLMSPENDHLGKASQEKNNDKLSTPSSVSVCINPLSSAKKKKLSLKSTSSSYTEQNKMSTPKSWCGSERRVLNFETETHHIRASNHEPLQDTPQRKANDIGSVIASTSFARGSQRTSKDVVTNDVLDMNHSNVEMEDEASPIIKRKRKPVVVLDSSSDDETSNKNAWLCSEPKHRKSYETSKEESKSFEEKQASFFHGIEDEDDDDFEDLIGPKPTVPKGKKNDAATATNRKTKHAKILKKGGNFIDDEAEVSGEDGSSDEQDERGDDDDMYEMSFINNDTEKTQLDHTDMRALYLKSVRNGPNHGGYKLQFNHVHKADIYSQILPEDQGLSEYEEDSFCVGSEEEDSPIIEKKSKKKKSKTKKRVQMLSVSSSSQETALPFTQEVTTNRRSLVRKAFVSSSEDEDGSEDRKNIDSVGTLNDTSLGDDENYTDKLSFTKPMMKNIPANSAYIKNSSVLVNIVSDSSSLISKAKSDVFDTIDGIPLNDLDEWSDDFNAVDINCPSQSTAVISKKEIKTAQSNTSMTGSNHSQASWSSSKFQRSEEGEFQCQLSLSEDNNLKSKILSSEDERTSIDSHRNSSAFFVPEYSSGLKSASANSTTSAKPFISSVTTSMLSSKNLDYTSNNLSSQNEQNCFMKKNNMMSSGGKDVAREERLKRQKEKQERFRQKLAQVQQSKSLNTTATTATGPVQADSSSVLTSDVSVNAPSPVVKEMMQILVDTREISSAQEIISALRLKHNITVTARQIGSCDYVLSNYLVVERQYWSAFSNGSNRKKLASRLCEMKRLYGKCIVIVETDKIKSGQEKNRRPLHRSKYVDMIMACILQTGVKLYFTDSTEETASLLSVLCQKEQRKGRHLSVPVKLNPKKEGMFQFIMSIPQVNIMEALNLAYNYKNLMELISSPAALIQRRGFLSSEKTQNVYNYFRHEFDLQMLPAVKR